MVLGAFLLTTLIAPFIPAQNEPLPPVPDLAPRLDEFDATSRTKIRDAGEQIRLHPRDAEANGRMGMLLHAHQRYEFAEPFYLRARILDPSSFSWAYYLGIIQARLGKPAEASSSLRLATQLKPDYLPARLALAEALRKLGELEQSRELYRQIVQDRPESASAWAGLGRISWQAGEVSEAVENYQKAVERFSRYGAAHYALGLAHRSLGNLDKMQEHFSQFQRHSSQQPPVEDPLLDAVQALESRAGHFLREGFVLREERQYKEAAAAFEEVLKLEPGHSIAHANLVSLYIALRNPAMVEHHYRSAIAADSGLYKTHYNFGTYLGWRGRTADAIVALRKAVEINPFHADSHSNLGHLLAQLGRSMEAETHLRLAIRHQPNFPLPHFNLGRLLLTQGRYEEAVRHLQETLDGEDDGDPLHVYTLALAYAQLGKLERAKHYALAAKRNAVAPEQAGMARDIESLLTELERAAKSHGK
ncbi:MAG: tetratricopeptide repeat protein [Candidatus Aminicenantes bacterium]|nr:tetratricopeptide repeat protein [Candidatus Aminicenantes bacterium]